MQGWAKRVQKAVGCSVCGQFGASRDPGNVSWFPSHPGKVVSPLEAELEYSGKAACPAQTPGRECPV